MDHNHPPRPGDLTVCFGCGHLLTFTDDMALRELPREELAELPTEKRNLLERTQRAVRMYRREHPWHAYFKV